MKKKTAFFIGVICFAGTASLCLSGAEKGSAESEKIGPQKIGEFCISQTYPGLEWEAADNRTAAERAHQIADETVDKFKKEVDNSRPRVIIYHTHSSESYMPYSESNFHREDEKGTVREVGDVMAAELNKLGISVVHDKTVHDRPSYNQSYDRSLETVNALLRQYPDAEVVIDLHRDAAAYTGNKAECVSVNGESAAKYKLVIGQGNDNYSQLMSFAGRVNDAAGELFPGFEGRILEKEYRFNEYISDQYLLLEIGNNQNDIEQAKTTGKYFAHVLAAVLEE